MQNDGLADLGSDPDSARGAPSRWQGVTELAKPQVQGSDPNSAGHRPQRAAKHTHRFHTSVRRHAQPAIEQAGVIQQGGDALNDALGGGAHQLAGACLDAFGAFGDFLYKRICL